jgi:chromosome condensin MukBEF complex kleisin-like MukF subunit
VDAQVIELVAGFGPLGIASGFIAWMYLRMQARLDALVDKFQGQIDLMQVRHDEKEEALRARYDDVIANYNKERDTLLQGVSATLQETSQTLREMNDRLENTALTIAAGLAEMRQHYAVLDAERSAKRER